MTMHLALLTARTRFARSLRLLALLLAALPALVLAACGSAGSDPLAAATVDGQTISFTAFAQTTSIFTSNDSSQGQLTAWQSPAGRSALASAQANALSFLVDAALFDAQVHSQRIVVTTKDVQQEATALANSVGVNASQTPSDPNVLALERAAHQATIEAAHSPSQSDLLSGRPTLAQTVLIFAHYGADFNALHAKGKVPTAHVRLIEVATSKQANDLKQQAQHGADFGALARQDSLDKSSAAKSGDLGTLYVGQLSQQSPELDSAIFGPHADYRAARSYVIVPYQHHYLLCEITQRGTSPLSAISDSQTQSNVFGAWVSIVLLPGAQIQQYVAIDPTPTPTTAGP